MNASQKTLWIAGLIAALNAPAESPRISLRRSTAGIDLTWPATQTQPGGLVRPYFEVQRSTDLTHWQSIGQRQRAAATPPSQSLSITEPSAESAGFYRLLTFQPVSVARLADGGADVFGYQTAFDEELARIGQVSPDQFASRYPNPPGYLPKLSWDPTTAKFWSNFNAEVVTKGNFLPFFPFTPSPPVGPGSTGTRTFNTRLNPAELAVFKTNGFVVSERLGATSFGRSFYDLWHDDLPVFISTDALLHAWHRTYDGMLQEIEETYLYNSVGLMLEGMAGEVAAANSTIGNGVLRDSLRDADWFLAVARSLLAGINQPPVPSLLGQNARVAATLADIKSETLKEVEDFMGFCRTVDFSQFKIRGHYADTPRLGQYFQCVMWLGRIDVPVAGGPFERCPGKRRLASTRELGTAVVFWDLLHRSGKFPTWAGMEKVVTTFVGWTDSLNFGQLDGLLAGAGIRSLADLPDLATLERLQADITRGELGLQNIRSDYFLEPLDGPARSGLPRTFTVFGQKFVPDSWAFSQSVFSSIQWVDKGVTNRVQRRVPGALDVAFATLGNNQVVPELVAQMKGTYADPGRPHALTHRDGKPYQHNLAAVRTVMDSQSPEAWSDNLYLGWLDTLRQLSPPTTTAIYPEAMRTRAWAMKTVNTQLASWTQLRHDTVLYAKQSFTGGGICVYPTGYVEPRVEFWSRLKTMATQAAAGIAALNYPGTYAYTEGGIGGIKLTTNVVQLRAIQNRQVAHLQNFAAIAQQLEGLAQKELAQQCFTPEDLAFVDHLMEVAIPGGGCAPEPSYTGWYPPLFYRAIYQPDNTEFRYKYGCEAFAGLVTDVHTDVPNDVPPDPGSVLHEAVGRVNLLMLAVDSGGDRFVCAGPVLSHYEFEVTGEPYRFNDEQWQPLIEFRQVPFDLSSQRLEGVSPPPWTRGFLVPK